MSYCAIHREPMFKYVYVYNMLDSVSVNCMQLMLVTYLVTIEELNKTNKTSELVQHKLVFVLVRATGHHQTCPRDLWSAAMEPLLPQ